MAAADEERCQPRGSGQRDGTGRSGRSGAGSGMGRRRGPAVLLLALGEAAREGVGGRLPGGVWGGRLSWGPSPAVPGLCWRRGRRGAPRATCWGRSVSLCGPGAVSAERVVLPRRFLPPARLLAPLQQLPRALGRRWRVRDGARLCVSVAQRGRLLCLSARSLCGSGVPTSAREGGKWVRSAKGCMLMLPPSAAGRAPGRAAGIGQCL